MCRKAIVYNKVLWFGVLLLFRAMPLFSQSLAKEFSIKDGLPSNHIYSLAQDKKGFLWISTDNGLTRFDGKYFRVFNTNDGLPDNEVLEVLVENDGTIWANTFKQGPVYFDEKTSRFVDPLKGVNINRDFVSLVMFVRKLANGGIVFFNSGGEMVFRNRKYVKPPVPRAFSYWTGSHYASLGLIETRDANNKYFRVFYNEGNENDTAFLFKSSMTAERVAIAFLDSSRLFVIGDKNTIYKVEKPDPVTKKFKIDSIIINEKPVFFRVTDRRLNVSTASGKIYVYDKKTLEEHYPLDDKGVFYNCILEDNEKNIWAGTMNPIRGLLVYKLRYTEKLSIAESSIDNSFLSVLVPKDGKIYAGNYTGQVVVNSNGTTRVFKQKIEDNQKWIRELIEMKNKIFQFSEEASYVDFSRKVMLGNSPLIRLKCAAPLNDSIIVTGGVSGGGGLYKINAITEKATRLNSELFRVSAIGVLDNRYVYCGTNNGLFKYDYERGELHQVLKDTRLGNQRIMAVGTSPEGLVWVATSSDGIYVLKDDRVISRIDYSQILSQVVNCIFSTAEKTAWIGSRGGLTRIRYELDGQNVLKFRINNFSATEGIPSNNVTDVDIRNDSIFIATNEGIIYLPKNLHVEIAPIKTHLVQILVDHKTIPLTPDNNYHLEYHQRSVTLEFSGVNLAGHLKKLQYTFDSTKGWIDIDADDLNLELSAGEHTLFVRSLDNNNSGAGPILPVTFHIHAPFYMRTWFIITIVAIAAGLITLITLKIRTARQKREWLQQLSIEQERNRITSDLHDDIGSTLSSLQIYSDIAYNVIDKDKGKAKNLLSQISTGASKISENISDIIWSMKGNDSHILTPTTRIKNIVSETLSPTDIDYELQLDDTFDRKITCIICRKNFVLIIKEAINNIMKYSEASNVLVKIQPAGEHYVLTIEDNGIGMNLSERLHQGNGLSNMKKRTEEIGGTFEIDTSPGNGTKIVVRVPVANISGCNR